MKPNSHPPLTWLRAFEAAGRTGSFKAASEFLHVSPSTISHQIRDLELFIGVPLFSRQSNSIQLTEEGEHYLVPLTSAFALIGSAFETAFESARDPGDHFSIGAFPFLTNEVLLPNVDSLRRALGRTKLSFRSDTGVAPLMHTSPSKRLDVVVRYGTTNPGGGLLALELFDIELVPIQSVSKPLITDAQTLLTQPIIQILGPFDAWREWAQFIGISERPTNIVMETDNYHAATLAATRGDGMCLGILPFMSPWLQARKVQPLEQFRSKIPFKAYLVYSPHNRDNPAIPRLREWIVDKLT